MIYGCYLTIERISVIFSKGKLDVNLIYVDWEAEAISRIVNIVTKNKISENHVSKITIIRSKLFLIFIFLHK